MSHCETFTYHTTQNIHLYLPLYKLPLNTLLHQPILQQYHFKYFYTFLDLQPFCFRHINYQPWYTMLIYIRVFIDFLVMDIDLFLGFVFHHIDIIIIPIFTCIELL